MLQFPPEEGTNSVNAWAIDMDTIKTHKNSGDKKPKMNADDAKSIAPAVLT